MAGVRKCKTCSTPISTKASACPKCGHQYKAAKVKIIKGGCLLKILMIAIVGGAYWIGSETYDSIEKKADELKADELRNTDVNDKARDIIRGKTDFHASTHKIFERLHRYLQKEYSNEEHATLGFFKDALPAGIAIDILLESMNSQSLKKLYDAWCDLMGYERDQGFVDFVKTLRNAKVKAMNQELRRAIMEEHGLNFER